MVGINRRSRKYRAFGLRELLLAVIAFYFWLGWYNQYFFSNEESAIAITDVNTISYTFDKEIIQSKWHPVESFHNVMKTNNCRVLKSCIQHYPKCPMGCKCFCDNLCKIQPVSNITRYMTMNNTSSPKDRLIPKIVHQTWKNPVTKEEYPNMSRFVQSWQQSGWSYVFYDDDDAASFIASNFPSEVKEAYDALIPGAFKADFFRYCILFIHGGVYADIDILCTCDLDSAIDSDVSFLVPIDLAPGKNGNSCLWNGFIASAPGHP